MTFFFFSRSISEYSNFEGRREAGLVHIDKIILKKCFPLSDVVIFCGWFAVLNENSLLPRSTCRNPELYPTLRNAAQGWGGAAQW